MLGWLVYEHGIEPHVTVFDKSTRQDGTFSRDDLRRLREMRELANDCRILLEKSGVEAPALRQLYRAIDTYAA
jgi:hypothetical protein